MFAQSKWQRTREEKMSSRLRQTGEALSSSYGSAQRPRTDLKFHGKTPVGCVLGSGVPVPT